ncbi:MAG: MazG nucleotide pyrophosphohydrolase domain-containing protein [archaeon]
MATIRQFQQLMKDLYFDRDNDRGIPKTYDWLKDEIQELGDELDTNNKRALEDEFADVIAWLTSLANLLDVDLEAAALRKYDKKCPKCNDSPCSCPIS